jgi:hypothetical protein
MNSLLMKKTPRAMPTSALFAVMTLPVSPPCGRFFLLTALLTVWTLCASVLDGKKHKAGEASGLIST